MNAPLSLGVFAVVAIVGGVILGTAATALDWAVRTMESEERARSFTAGPDLHEVTELGELYPEAQA
jgi:hypothetical protein